MDEKLKGQTMPKKLSNNKDNTLYVPPINPYKLASSIKKTYRVYYLPVSHTVYFIACKIMNYYDMIHRFEKAEFHDIIDVLKNRINEVSICEWAFHPFSDTFILVIKKEDFNANIDVHCDVLSAPIDAHGLRVQLILNFASYCPEQSYTSLETIIDNLLFAIEYPNYALSPKISSYDESQRENFNHEMSIIQELIGNYTSASKSLKVHFQPIVSLKTSKIIAFESLLRLNNEKLKNVSPQIFIALAEKYQLLKHLTATILELSFKDFVNLKKTFPDTHLHVNVSATELTHTPFITNLEKLRKKYDLAIHDICIEITESTALHHIKCSFKRIDKLRNLGYNVVLDDFGKGYSSLAYLHEIPFTKIKLDKNFVTNLNKDSHHEIFISGILFTIKSLGAKIVVEGIETKEQSNLLKKIGADFAQGNYYAKPQPYIKFIENKEKYLNFDK